MESDLNEDEFVPVRAFLWHFHYGISAKKHLFVVSEIDKFHADSISYLRTIGRKWF